MPRAKRSRAEADLDGRSEPSPSTKNSKKRAAAAQSETQKRRKIPCVGCLVGLINWMPEDGEPNFCYDTAAPGKSVGDKDDVTCIRCQYQDKSCSIPREMDESVRHLCQKLTQSPRDTESIRAAQRSIRHELIGELHVEACMFGSTDFRDPDELDEDPQYMAMYRIGSTIDTIRTLVDAMGSRRAWREVREVHRATETAAELMQGIREKTPQQFADVAADQLGIF